MTRIRRKKSVAESVLQLPAALNQAVLETLTPDQRAELTPTQAGRITECCSVLAQAIGYVIEQPGGKFKVRVSHEENADGC